MRLCLVFPCSSAISLRSMFSVALLRASSSSRTPWKAVRASPRRAGFEAPKEAVQVLHAAAGSVLSRSLHYNTTESAAAPAVFRAPAPDVTSVGTALLFLERWVKAGKSGQSGEPAGLWTEKELEGSWRLVYSIQKSAQNSLSERLRRGELPSSLRAGLYFPLEARIQFSVENHGSVIARAVTNEAHLPFRLAGIKFAGPWMFEPKQRRLMFDFCEFRLHLMGATLPRIRIKKWPTSLEALDLKDRRRLPFFTFFFVDSRILAGRGRGGGLALWARESA